MFSTVTVYKIFLAMVTNALQFTTINLSSQNGLGLKKISQYEILFLFDFCMHKQMKR